MKRGFAAVIALSVVSASLIIFLRQTSPDPAPAAEPVVSYRGPLAAVVSRDGKRLYVANADAGEIAVVSLEDDRRINSICLPDRPTGLVRGDDDETLYVTCAAPRSTVVVVDARLGTTRRTLPGGHTSTGPALSPDGRRLYVCNRFDNDLAVIDVQAAKEVRRIPVRREPVAAAVTPDGKSVFVANHLPAGRSDTDDTAAVVSAIDAETGETAEIRLPAGSSSLRGVCVSPNGARVYVTHVLARYNMPTTQLDRGWMNTNALSVLDAHAKTWINTVLLDEVDSGAANPWAVACTPDGRWLCVSHAGSHELSVIDTRALQARLAAAARTADEPKTIEVGKQDKSIAYHVGSRPDVPDDLSFLVGLRRRIALPGQGPRGIAVGGSKVYVTEYYSGTVAVVDLGQSDGEPIRQISLGPQPPASPDRCGEMLFHDARLCFQHWQSCASCHPDARADGFNWDLMNDGLGNPKNTRSMLLAHRTPPSMSLGVRDSAEVAVRSGIQHILFAARPESDAAAIDAYLGSLPPVPSPHLRNGGLSQAAQRGKALFLDASVGCASCHPAPLYTDRRRHDVGSAGPYDRRSEFDTPTLIECWRTAPYMHDGSFATIKELLRQARHGSTAGAVETLTPDQIDDLVAFVLSL
ncbi:MAG: beta-propeller fold lactonase family protein [Planctomycetes bacterium]|nr:beta-propeller fold lactonase family protein [Planctomycetota bacterium]